MSFNLVFFLFFIVFFASAELVTVGDEVSLTSSNLPFLGLSSRVTRRSRNELIVLLPVFEVSIGSFYYEISTLKLIDEDVTVHSRNRVDLGPNSNFVLNPRVVDITTSKFLCSFVTLQGGTVSLVLQVFEILDSVDGDIIIAASPSINSNLEINLGLIGSYLALGGSNRGGSSGALARISDSHAVLTYLDFDASGVFFELKQAVVDFSTVTPFVAFTSTLDDSSVFGPNVFELGNSVARISDDYYVVTYASGQFFNVTGSLVTIRAQVFESNTFLPVTDAFDVSELEFSPNDIGLSPVVFGYNSRFVISWSALPGNDSGGAGPSFSLCSSFGSSIHARAFEYVSGSTDVTSLGGTVVLNGDENTGCQEDVAIEPFPDTNSFVIVYSSFNISGIIEIYARSFDYGSAGIVPRSENLVVSEQNLPYFPEINLGPVIGAFDFQNALAIYMGLNETGSEVAYARVVRDDTLQRVDSGGSSVTSSSSSMYGIF